MSARTAFPTVWADESSSTGENLTDPTQPVYAAAAIALDEPTAAALVGNVRGALPVTVTEPKYTTAASSRAGRDALLGTLAQLCHHIGTRLGSFRLVHDRSNVLARHAVELLSLDRIGDPARPGRMLEPLPAVDFAFADSRTSPQLQLADLVAGAARQWATSRVRDARDSFAERLGHVLEPHFAGGLWPDPDLISNPRVIV